MIEKEEIDSALNEFENGEIGDTEIPQRIIENITQDEDIIYVKQRFNGYISKLYHIKDLSEIGNYGPYYDFLIKIVSLANKSDWPDEKILKFITEEDIHNVMAIGLKQSVFKETSPREIIEMHFDARVNKVLSTINKMGWLKKTFAVSKEACDLIDFQYNLINDELFKKDKDNPFMKDILRCIVNKDDKIKNSLSNSQYVKLKEIKKTCKE